MDKSVKPAMGVQAALDKVEHVMQVTGEADERDNPGHEREAGAEGGAHSPAGAPPPNGKSSD